jgi:hypothetical protein
VRKQTFALLKTIIIIIIRAAISCSPLKFPLHVRFELEQKAGDFTVVSLSRQMQRNAVMNYSIKAKEPTHWARSLHPVGTSLIVNPQQRSCFYSYTAQRWGEHAVKCLN